MLLLDLGCGRHVHPGAIGVDVSPHSDADVLADLNHFPYPFADDSFDEIWCSGVIEHLSDVVGVMEEVHRIAKPSARVVISAPYFSSLDAFTDPTHRHFFSARSFDYFTGDFPEYGFYSSRTLFVKRKVEITFWSLPRLGGLRPHHLLGAHWLARYFTSIYERFFAFVLPAQSIRYDLEVVESCQRRDKTLAS